MPGAVNVDIYPGTGVEVVSSAETVASRLPAGHFSEAHAVNPFGYNPVSPETARLMQPGGLLYVTGTAKNKFAQPLTPEAARAAGFELVETKPMIDAHKFGIQRSTEGGELKTTTSTTTIYRRLP
jgi:hypothetical protein